MIDKANIEKTNSWPFVEAKRIIRDRKKSIDKKGKIILQTGYGPSGLPHIGTFGEVARTSMIVNALNHLTDIPKEIITFSDDMDGLRKIPDNVPNQKILSENLHKPLTDIPDPFGKFESFGQHNNEMLINFLNAFKFKYKFKSSTELYKSGFFNESLKLILKNYKNIMEIIIPTLGKDRQKTYSPFLPICPETGVVLEIPIIEIDEKNSKIVFDIRESFDYDTHCQCCRSQGNLRPHVVWFGEMPFHINKINMALEACDIFASIGTSGNVYPAAGFSQTAKIRGAHTVELNLEQTGSSFDTRIYGPATQVVPEYFEGVLRG